MLTQEKERINVNVNKKINVNKILKTFSTINNWLNQQLLTQTIKNWLTNSITKLRKYTGKHSTI